MQNCKTAYFCSYMGLNFYIWDTKCIPASYSLHVKSFTFAIKSEIDGNADIGLKENFWHTNFTVALRFHYGILRG